MKYWWTTGRFQPLHDGHVSLLRKALAKYGQVVVFLRDTNVNKSNPYSIEQRYKMFSDRFGTEIESGQMVVTYIRGVDIGGVFYGRSVGWGIEQIHLDEETEAISATVIRGAK